jgi:glycosyltransferase involved in cell wall biosynthesis
MNMEFLDMDNFILSVIVPTKNRAKYANKTVRQILQVCGKDVEIVVQDNSTDDILEKMLADIKRLENLKYNHIYELLSFVDNFDQALQLATGEYVIMVGDDDGVTTGLLKTVIWAKEREIDVIRPNLNIVYFWPGSRVFPKEIDNGRLKIVSSSKRIHWEQAANGVCELLKNGCQDYLECELVKIYHGIVKRKLLDKIKESTGRYVGGLSPDIYLSVALSLVFEKSMVCVDIPLTISGICGGSGSSQSSTGEHTGKLKDAPHFKGHISYKWSKQVPAFYSVETIWADSALAAIRDIAPRKAGNFRYEKLLDVCLRKYPVYREVAIAGYRENKGNKIKYYLWKIGELARRSKKSICYRLRKHHIEEWEEVEDILQASNICEEHLGKAYNEFEEICNAAKIPGL